MMRSCAWDCSSDTTPSQSCTDTVSRTIEDAIIHEDEIDMQGTIEALSAYYFRHGENTDGIDVKAKYMQDFERILVEAKEYYDY